MIDDLVGVLGLLAGQAEGGRHVPPIAHLVLVLALLAVPGLVYLIRRVRRRSDQTHERQRFPEEQ